MADQRRRTYADLLRQAMEQLQAEAMAYRAGAEEGCEDETDPAEPLRQFLSRYLGSRYGFGAGWTYDSKGQASDYLGIILYDAAHCPLRPLAEEEGQFFSESVCAVIDVHWTLTADALAEAAERVASVKALDRSAFIRRDGPPDPLAAPDGVVHYGPLPPVWGLVFGFQGDSLSDVLLPTLAGLDQSVPEEEQVDCVCVLDQGLILRGEAESMPDWSVVSSFPGTSLCCCERPDEGWLLLYPVLTRELSSRELGSPELSRYLHILFPDLPPPRRIGDDEPDEEEGDEESAPG